MTSSSNVTSTTFVERCEFWWVLNNKKCHPQIWKGWTFRFGKNILENQQCWIGIICRLGTETFRSVFRVVDLNAAIQNMNDDLSIYLSHLSAWLSYLAAFNPQKTTSVAKLCQNPPKNPVATTQRLRNLPVSRAGIHLSCLEGLVSQDNKFRAR